MIEKETINFLDNLQRNNNRDWFHAHKNEYEAAKQNIINVIIFLTNEIGKFDSDIYSFDPKRALFRIARDTRFASDKTPYKSNFGACIHPQGKNIYNLSTYYLHIQPDESFLSAGVYMPDKNFLNMIRKSIYYDFDNFYSIVSDSIFIKHFGNLSNLEGKLSRVPAGFDKCSPAAEYLKYKNYYVYETLNNSDLLDEHVFKKKVITSAKLMKPFNDFFNHHVKNVTE